MGMAQYLTAARRNISNNMKSLCLSVFNGGLFHQGLLQPPGFAVAEIEKMRVVYNTVEKGGGDFNISENIIPTRKLQVGSDDDGFAFITLGNDLKKQFSAVRINGNITPFVTNQQIQVIKLLHKARQISLLFSLGERVDKNRSTPKAGFEAGVAGGHPDGDCQMSFSGPNSSKQDKIFPPGNKRCADNIIRRQSGWEPDILKGMLLPC